MGLRHRTLQSNQAVRLKANTFSAFLKTEIVGRVLLSKHRKAELFLPRGSGRPEGKLFPWVERAQNSPSIHRFSIEDIHL